MSESILQFGTGKFLRCFVDLFVDELNRPGDRADRIVIVQSTGTARADAFNSQQCQFRAAIRGLEAGQVVDRVEAVHSVSRALAATRDWPAVLELADSRDLTTIVSNVTEAGYRLEPGDRLAAVPPRSFPAKLTAVLWRRFEAGLPGVTLLPCELLDDNAGRLLKLASDQAAAWQLPAEFQHWLATDCHWRNTLVDRIVSAPQAGDPWAARDPLFAVAEPFALWAVEGQGPLPVLSGHPAVQMVDDLGPYHLRKVRILNAAHSALVAYALPRGFTIVRDAVLDAEVGGWLRRLLFDEIVPLLEGRTDGPDRFARQTLERFANPFLDHRLADIALAHDTKLRTRLLPSLTEFRQRFGREPEILHQLVGGIGG